MDFGILLYLYIFIMVDFIVTTVNSRYNQVGLNELSGYSEVIFVPHVALLA